MTNSTMRVPVGTPLVNADFEAEKHRYALGGGFVPQDEASSSAAFGGASAAGYSAIAQGLGDMGHMLREEAVDLQRRADETCALEAYNQLNERAGVFFHGGGSSDGSPENSSPETGLQLAQASGLPADQTANQQPGLYSQTGGADVGAVVRTREFFEKSVAELSRGLTKEAARIFADKALALRGSEQMRVSRFEANERRQWEFDTLKATISGERKAALENFESPQLRDRALERGNEIIGKLCAMNNMPLEAEAELQRNLRAEVMLEGAEIYLNAAAHPAVMDIARDASLTEAQRLDLVQRAAKSGFNDMVNYVAQNDTFEGLKNLQAMLREPEAAGDAAPEITPESLAAYKELAPEDQLEFDIRAMTPEDREAAYEHLSGLIRKQRINEAFAVVADLSEDKAREIMDSAEFRREFELDGQDAEEVRGDYATKLNFDKTVRQKERDEAMILIGAEVLNLALGRGDKAADPLAAYDLLADSDLDEDLKTAGLQAIVDRRLDERDDPAEVAGLIARIAAAGHDVTDGDLARPVLAGQMTTRTLGIVESLRKAARGGHAWLIALSYKLLDEAMDKRVEKIKPLPGRIRPGRLWSGRLRARAGTTQPRPRRRTRR